MSTSQSRSFPWMTLLGGIVLIGAIGALFLLPARYEAFALLKISRHEPGVAGMAGESAEDFEIFKRTQAQLIKSPSVVREALKDSKVKQLKSVERDGHGALAWLHDQLVVDFPDDSEIMRVSLSGPDGGELSPIVDSIVRAYLRNVVEQDRDPQLANTEALDRALQTQLAELAHRREALRKAQAAEGTPAAVGTALAKKLANEQLDEFLAQRSRITAAMVELDTKIAMAQSRDNVLEEANPAEQARAILQPLDKLQAQKEFLNRKLQEVGESLLKQAENLENLEGFSSRVEGKKDDVRALENIVQEMRSRLDHMRLRQGLPSRIQIVDQAELVPHNAAVRRDRAMCVVAALVGLALIVAGQARRPR